LSQRSVEQLRRYFALIRAVYYHWPETHKEQFANENDLRKYLQMRAGHWEIGSKVELGGLSKEQALLLAEAAIRGSGTYAVPRIHGDSLVVFRPRSIAFRNLGHREFCELNEKVSEVIKTETGLDHNELLKDVQS
jgi:hypothetical protein